MTIIMITTTIMPMITATATADERGTGAPPGSGNLASSVSGREPICRKETRQNRWSSSDRL